MYIHFHLQKNSPGKELVFNWEIPGVGKCQVRPEIRASGAKWICYVMLLNRDVFTLQFEKKN